MVPNVIAFRTDIGVFVVVSTRLTVPHLTHLVFISHASIQFAIISCISTVHDQKLQMEAEPKGTLYFLKFIDHIYKFHNTLKKNWM